MSFDIKSAFNLILNLRGLIATIERRNQLAPIGITIAPSNYFRDFDTTEEIPVSGNEFVIGRDQLLGTTFESTGVKRGDVVVSPFYGTFTVEEVRPMVIFQELAGYRIRTTK